MGFQRSCLVAVGAILLATTGLVNQGLAFPRPPIPHGGPPIFIPPPPEVVIGVPAPPPPPRVRIHAPPPIVYSTPPEMVMIPDTDVYYAPDLEDEIVFSQGFYWRPYDGRWYRSRSHNGPWNHIVRGRVPHGIIGLPPGYRQQYYGQPRFHHREVERRWHGGGPRGGPHPGPHGGPPHGGPPHP